jgi:hypothetical protein
VPPPPGRRCWSSGEGALVAWMRGIVILKKKSGRKVKENVISGTHFLVEI